jgi:hypothetical protein
METFPNFGRLGLHKRFLFKLPYKKLQIQILKVFCSRIAILWGLLTFLKLANLMESCINQEILSGMYKISNRNFFGETCLTNSSSEIVWLSNYL